MSETDQPRRARMPIAELRRAAELMYGPEWQSPLARDLGVAVRTVQRWAAGGGDPPDVRADLAAVCRRRGAELLALAEQLEA